LLNTVVPAQFTSNGETIKKYRKRLTPRNGNSTWASAERNDPRSHINLQIFYNRYNFNKMNIIGLGSVLGETFGKELME
jgi:hypothetical protein